MEFLQQSNNNNVSLLLLHVSFNINDIYLLIFICIKCINCFITYTLVVCMAIATFSCLDCKNINVTHNSEGSYGVTEKILLPQNETTAILETGNPEITDDRKIITPQNKTTEFQKNITSITVQQNEPVIVLSTDRKPKTRQVPVEVLMTASSNVMDNMNDDQSYYQSPLMFSCRMLASQETLSYHYTVDDILLFPINNQSFLDPK
ncbi:hypothetical protein AGLY_005496, partial [Aphis glycines]